MRRVFIKTYGCQMNERDSEAVAAMLMARGYTLVETEGEADIVLLNTCSVREAAEHKAMGKTGHLLKRKRDDGQLIVGIMGCMAQNRGASLAKKLKGVDLIAGTQKFHHVPDYLDKLVAEREQKEESIRQFGPLTGLNGDTIIDLAEEPGSQDTIRGHYPDRRQVSAFVSIMQGCNMRCSFCIVPKTRGDERCRPISEVVEEVQELVAQGTREITLLGQIVTSYGRREIPFVASKSPFVQLLEALQEVSGLERIRFTSPHPRGFKRDLMEAIRDLSKVCEQVHLPLQSGSDKMLKAMNRPYSATRYREIVAELRSLIPVLYLSTDIIVGYPGETPEDFEETRRLFEELAFDMAFIFKYSERKGTPAEGLPDQVEQAVREERNQILLKLLEKASLRRNQSLVGTVQEVLVEGPARRGEDMLIGRNRGGRKVVLEARSRHIGELLPVKIEKASVSALEGRPVLIGVDSEKSLMPNDGALAAAE